MITLAGTIFANPVHREGFSTLEKRCTKNGGSYPIPQSLHPSTFL
jgi:hypothetical protein